MSEEILEGNKLIAEFMGWKCIIQKSGLGSNEGFHHAQPTGATMFPTWPIIIEDIKYDSSWDWLMPVIEKIQHLDDIGDIKIEIDFQIHLLGAVELWLNNKRVFAMTAFEKGTLINAVYAGVLEFIKWYNNERRIN